MPPKTKLHKHTSKAKVQVQTPEGTTETAAAPNTAQVEQNFELELCWCIQQLQSALADGKLNSRQMQDHKKALNILKSHRQPMVSKRQVMRLSFGDYRSKMAQEEQKLDKSQIKLKVAPGNPSSKSMFVRKSPFLANSGNCFRFNFEERNGENCRKEEKGIELQNAESKFQFKHSDNSFRFNFDSNDS